MNKINDNKKSKIEIPDVVRAYYSKIGKMGGETNKKKGSEYFKWVRSHAKKGKNV